MDVELNRRTALASSAFSQLSKVWRNRNIRLPVKMRIYNACVLPVFSYGSETWQLTEKQEKKLDVFDQRCLRRILRVRWQQRVSNAEIRRRSQQEALSVKTRKARLRWFGHVSRMETQKWPEAERRAADDVAEDGRGRPRANGYHLDRGGATGKGSKGLEGVVCPTQGELTNGGEEEEDYFRGLTFTRNKPKTIAYGCYIGYKVVL